MKNHIKSDSSGKEEAHLSTAKIIAEVKHLFYIFDILHKKVKEISLSLIELKKRNPLIRSKVEAIDADFINLFSEVLDEILTLLNMLSERNEEKKET